MTKWPWLLTLTILLLAGCGGDTPTRSNDFTPLTSLQIVLPLTSIVTDTSIQVRAIGNFSGLFTRDVTDEVVWSSSDDALASFALRPGTVGRVQGVATGTPRLTATFAGTVSASVDLTVVAAPLTAITVSPVDPTIAKGLTRTLTASGHFDDGTPVGIDQDISYDVIWSSSAPTVAIVSNLGTSPGLVSALLEGTATMTAAPSWSGVTGTSLVTVSAAALQAITLSPTNAAVLSLSERQFSASGSFSDGSSQDLTSQVTWSSSNSAVAAIAPSGVASGLIAGTTTVGATLAGVSATTPLQVTGGNLSSLTIAPVNPSLALSSSRRLTATGTFSNGTQRDITRAVTWSLLTPAIGTIDNVGDNHGKLLATTAGTSQVRAVSGSVTGETTLTVHSGTLSSLAITPGPAEDLLVTTTLALAVTGTYSNNETQDLTEDVSWSSDNPAAATIDATGLQAGTVRSVAVGTTHLQASLSGVISPTLAVTVAAATPVSLTIAPLAASTGPGGSVQMSATADFGGGVTRDVTRDVNWSLDDASVAVQAHAVLHPGLIYGVRAGTATVQASFAGTTATTTLSVP